MVDDGFDLLYEYSRYGNMLDSYLAKGVSPQRYTQLAWLSLYSSRGYGIATTSESISITDEDLKREAFDLHLWLNLCASDFEGVFPPSLYNLLNNLDGRNRISTRETVLYNDIVPYLRATRYPFARLSQPESPTLVREPFILARLKGKTVSTFPDTGATANFLSIKCAQQHGFKGGSHIGEKIKVGNGALANILGAMTLPLSFRGETKVHQVEFKVLANCVHDVVLGSPFLKLTQTLSRLKDRIQQRVRKVLRHNRVCSLGSHQYVNGRLNDVDVCAVPDTGADVSVMSASFAKTHGFHVDTSERNRIILEFADGSSATTKGVVRYMEWKYGSSFANQGERLDMYVLEGLTEDVILSYDFLSATDAFVKFESDFWTNDEEGTLGVDWIFNIIKLVSKVLKQSMESKKDSSTFPTNTKTHPPDPAITWHQQKAEEIQLYRKARLEAQQLPEDQREAFLKPHLARWHHFLASRPAESDSSSAQSSSSSSSLPPPASAQGVGHLSVTPPPSPPANAPASAAKSSLLKGRSRLFGEKLKLRWRLHDDAVSGSSSLV